jgi:hypothetical protein
MQATLVAIVIVPLAGGSTLPDRAMSSTPRPKPGLPDFARRLQILSLPGIRRGKATLA